MQRPVASPSFFPPPFQKLVFQGGQSADTPYLKQLVAKIKVHDVFIIIIPGNAKYSVYRLGFY